MTTLAWIGNLFIVFGLWKMGDKWRHAFLFSIVGELAYIARSLIVGDLALAFICGVFCVMAGINWVKWGRQPDTAAEDVAGSFFKVPMTEWVNETFTSIWYGKNGAQSVTVRFKHVDGGEGTVTFSNFGAAKAMADRIQDIVNSSPYGLASYGLPTTFDREPLDNPALPVVSNR